MTVGNLVPGGDMPRDEVIQWADGFVLVYSITDRESFNFVKLAKGYIMEKKGGMSPGSYPQILVALLGNKGDMVHLRQVSTEEGDILAKDGDCIWAEVAAAEQVAPVADAFTELGRAVVAARKKNKQSLLDRMLGGKSGSGSGGSGVVGGAGVRMYSRGKSDSALPKNGF
ncbi:unnamed protein product [Darwinula stevensoni]|uniref:small monomeric GTPase n=1 Tax=Darwinula stevensoni TaxID=69355 RepID=A0A7R8XAK1_9CRUS|nr:unnamed protein product [Darwinula stevensoni]CAG0890091.1 unnamed protein product [Darwinula stevensoni]